MRAQTRRKTTPMASTTHGRKVDIETAPAMEVVMEAITASARTMEAQSSLVMEASVTTRANVTRHLVANLRVSETLMVTASLRLDEETALSVARRRAPLRSSKVHVSFTARTGA